MAETIDIDTKIEYIKKQKCFMKLTDNEVDVLATLLRETTFAHGDAIVKEGERVDSIYIIVNGTADVLRGHLANHVTEMTKLATLKAGDAIGLSDEGFYSLTGLRTATVVATTEMLTLKLSVTIFRGFALAYPHANEVMRKQAEQL
jgi:CRP-like cAMP-binding protein